MIPSPMICNLFIQHLSKKPILCQILQTKISGISRNASIYFKNQRSEWHIATKQKYTNSKLLPVQIFEHPVFRNQVEVNIKGKKNNNSLVFISINYLQLKPQRVAFFHFYLSGAPVIASVARKKNQKPLIIDKQRTCTKPQIWTWHLIIATKIQYSYKSSNNKQKTKSTNLAPKIPLAIFSNKKKLTNKSWNNSYQIIRNRMLKKAWREEVRKHHLPRQKEVKFPT